MEDETRNNDLERKAMKLFIPEQLRRVKEFII